MVSISAPTEGATVSGMVPIEIVASDAEDADGSLSVVWSTDGGSTWIPAAWNGATYDGSWESPSVSDGGAVVEVRATDSATNTVNATPVNVTVDNVDEAPAASVSAPTEGATVSGMVPIEIAASDAEDAPGSLTVQWSVDGGASWSPTTWNGGTALYEASWDSTTGPDGGAAVDTRATDSASNTTNATSVNITFDNGPSPSSVEEYASTESTTFGTVSGSYNDTYANGGGIEAITETASGGRKSNRTSRLAHSWTIPVTGGDVVTFVVEAAASASSDGDDFTFAYSTDGSTFTDMVTVNSATTGYLSYVMPPSTNGNITIRVTDSNRDRGNQELDTVWIDHLYIRSESPGPGTAPPAPDTVAAIGTGMDMIEVTWNDNSGGGAGFEIHRRATGSGTWSLAGTAPAGTGSFTDEGLATNTTYEYRVRVYAATGLSLWSATVQGTTLASSAIDLQATGYKGEGCPERGSVVE